MDSRLSIKDNLLLTEKDKQSSMHNRLIQTTFRKINLWNQQRIN